MANELFDNQLTPAEAAEIQRQLEEVKKAKDKRAFAAHVATVLENSAVNAIKKISGSSQKDVQNFTIYRQRGLTNSDGGIPAKVYQAYRRELESLISSADDLTGNHGSQLHAQVRSGVRKIWTSVSGM